MTEETPKQILVIDDDPNYRALLLDLLGKAFAKIQVATLDPLKSGLPDASFDWTRFDVVIIDSNLGKAGSGLECVDTIRRSSNRPPATVLLTEEGSEELAAKAFRQGVHDYLRKQGLTGRILVNSIRSAFEVRDSQKNKHEEISLNATQFSRTFFYEQANLARSEADAGKSRALLLVRPAKSDALGEPLGLLAMDEVTRYLAKLAVKILRTSRYPIRSTRFGESSIAVIAGDFGDAEGLETIIRKFLDALEQNPPEYGGTKLPTLVEVGAVRILSEQLEIGDLLALAEQTCAGTDALSESSYTIVDGVPPEKEIEKAKADGPDIDIQSAINESRMQPMFSPLMPVSDESVKYEAVDIFQINPYLVGHDGQSIAVSELNKDLSDDEVKKIIDRWTLREAHKRLSEFAGEKIPGFVMELSAPSSVDEALPGWIGKLREHFGLEKPPAFFCLKIDAETLMRETKAVTGVCIKLRQRFGFRIAIREVGSASLTKACFAQMPIDLVQVAADIVRPGKPAKSAEKKRDSLMEVIRAKNALSIVAGIDDVATLHAAISAGVDFVQGDFVAPEQLEIESSAGVESVSL
jgi:EAL domain-containing protein (putative c-di-GMP-specific phosphodiesterase class I)/DNA-binding response OmpR family regulator